MRARNIMRAQRADAVGLRPLKLFVGGVRERLVVAHRGRGKTVSARVARPALSAAPQLHR